MDEKSIEVKGKRSGLAEFTSNHTELLLQDFKQKATSVLNELKQDFVIDFPEQGMEVSLPAVVSDLPLFDTKVSQMVIRRLERVIEGSGLENNVAIAKEVMDNFRTIALRFPTRIPKYFKDYEVNESLNIISGYSNDNEKRKYYWADSSIERYQDETEPVILFALELARKGVDIPSKFNELEALYKKSKE